MLFKVGANMKLLLVSDLHIHTWPVFGFDKVTGLQKRLQEQRQVLQQIIDLVVIEKVTLVICGGDVFHKVGEVPVEALNVAKEFFGKLRDIGVSWFIVTGNHDLVKRESLSKFHSSVEIFSMLGGTFKIENDIIKGVDVETGNFKVKLVHWHTVMDYEELRGYDMVVCHKLPYGSVVGNYRFEDGVDWQRLAKNNRSVYFGHIHQRQQLAENCWVIGTPMPLTFGDVGDRGVLVVDTVDWIPKFHKLSYPEFITVKEADLVKADGNYYRVLGVKERIDKDNVFSVVLPEFFEERIKAQTFEGILDEWLKLRGKDRSYLDVIKDLVTSKGQLVREFFKGRLLQCEIENFMSVGNVTYNVKNGFTLVVGIGDQFGSNGSGKSTIFGESIFWALFGETTKGLTGDDVVRRGKKDCKVSVWLSNGATDYVVTRSRSLGLEVCLLDKDGSKDLVSGLRQVDRQKFLQDQILGFDKTVFRATCYFSQENVLMFTGLTDSEKTNMVTSLLGFEVYDDLQSRVKQKVGIVQENLVKIEEDIRGLQIRVEKDTLLLNSSISLIDSIQGEMLSIVDRVKQLTREVDALRNLKFESPLVLEKDWGGMIKDSGDIAKGLVNKRDTFEEKLEKLRSEIFEYARSVSVLSSKKLEKDSLLVSLRHEMKKLQELQLDEKCDKCGNTITKESVYIFIEEKKAKVVEVNIELEAIGKELTKLSQVSGEKEIELKSVEFDRKQLKVKYEEVEKDIREVMEERRQYEIEIRNCAMEREKVNSEVAIKLVRIEESDQGLLKLRDKVRVANVQKGEFEQKIITLEEKINENRKYRTCIELDIERLEFWKEAFSNKGIRSLLLDSFCNEINVLVNELLASVSKGMLSVVVSPIAEIKSGEQRNKIDIRVRVMGTQVQYSSLSGGEKRRVDSVLCIGLNRWVSQKYGLKNGLLGILIMDEVMSFLDPGGEEALAQVFYEEGVSRAIFVIQHTPSLLPYAARVVTVSKSSGVSEIASSEEHAIL